MTTNVNLGGLISDLKLTQAKISRALAILEMSNENFAQKFLNTTAATATSVNVGKRRGRKPGSKNKKKVVTTAIAGTATPTTGVVPPVAVTSAHVAASGNKRSEAQRARWARVNAIKAAPAGDVTTVSA